MTKPSSQRCPSCGADADGRFCGRCGATLVAGSAGCRRCGETLEPAARYCRRCGAPVSGERARPGLYVPSARTAWVAAAVACALALGGILLLLVRKETGAAAAVASAAPADEGGAPPDLTTMTPKERFDRLYNRVMRAAESGDATTVEQFGPMAVAAYGQLDAVDADARYHLAMLFMHTGQVDAAAAAADSLLRATPGHLLGYVLLGTVARYRKDDAGLRRAYRDFLAHYDAEMKAGRAEYQDHQRSVADFRTAAQAAVPDRNQTGGSR